MREADLANHLVNNTGSTTADKAAGDKGAEKAPGGKAAPEPEGHAPLTAHRYEFGSAEDFQLQQAMNFFKGVPVETAKVHDTVATTESHD
ncbi:hypothetical protein SBBP2_2410001 [Burkholderiales bacterium]|nr:hypothetical protein SBBP2_2410001 [Burkholderiales bacterium]